MVNYQRMLQILVPVFLILGLYGCSATKKPKDGPPKFYVDETRIPNAQPKIEPIAKYGNMPFYRVFGKRYYVMKSFKNYEEIGTASWYGTMFHNRKTSSGEPYNMLAMTAAHRTLPLPTYVEVTNLKNNKKIIVRVNDRGPFASNRIIDLSYVAAKKLGMLGRGTTVVKVRAIDPRTYGKPFVVAHKKPFKPIWQRITEKKTVTRAYTTHQKIKTISEPYRMVYLQVGAFKDYERAKRLKRQLGQHFNAPINIHHPTAHSYGLYRVQIGPFRDQGRVEHITHQLMSMGIKPNRTYGA